ncbi:hypothetical protein OSTOST_21547 [Ostertagia ostertagi]
MSPLGPSPPLKDYRPGLIKLFVAVILSPDMPTTRSQAALASAASSSGSASPPHFPGLLPLIMNMPRLDNNQRRPFQARNLQQQQQQSSSTTPARPLAPGSFVVVVRCRDCSALLRLICCRCSL